MALPLLTTGVMSAGGDGRAFERALGLCAGGEDEVWVSPLSGVLLGPRA